MTVTCRLWFLLHRQSFIHVVSSADLLGLRALSERTVQRRDSLASLSEKVCDGPSKITLSFISVSSVVAEQTWLEPRCLEVIDVSWVHDKLSVCSWSL